MNPKIKYVSVFIFIFCVTLFSAQGAIPNAINKFGLDFLRQQAADGEEVGNVVFSPYSIQLALAMAYVGADGATRNQMQKVLHYPEDEFHLLNGFRDLAEDLDYDQEAKFGNDLSIHVSNRIYLQQSYPILTKYINVVQKNFNSLPQIVDFESGGDALAEEINLWVSNTTRGKIPEIVSPTGFSDETRALLMNAIYLKASWASSFGLESTRSEKFWVDGKSKSKVPTMVQKHAYGIMVSKKWTAVSLSYYADELQFLIILPKKKDGLLEVEKELDVTILSQMNKMMTYREIELHLPKFKLEPSAIGLREILKNMGMPSVFDEPQYSADFTRMAPATDKNEYLYLGDVVHRAVIEIDENGTEAAAATTAFVLGAFGSAGPKPQPKVIKVDRPFVFAIQHVDSGTCLFLGHVTDPR